MKTVYLHIGTPKTGTTAIQKFMGHNRAVLEEKGVCYLDTGLTYPGIGIFRNAHFLIHQAKLEKGKRDYSLEKELFEKGFKALEESLAKKDTIVLSDEGIWNSSRMHAESWKEIRKRIEACGATLKVIVYLRRQDLLVKSYWAQQVKVGSTMTFDDYIAKRKYGKFHLDYAEHLDSLAEYLGKDNIIVRVYEKEQYEGADHSILSDFLKILGLEYDNSFEKEQTVYNVSLSGKYLEAKRLLNRNEYMRGKSNFMTYTLLRLQEEEQATRSTDQSVYLSEEIVQYLKETYSDSNSRVAREYLGREDGVLFFQDFEGTGVDRNMAYPVEELMDICSRIIQEERMERRELSKNGIGLRRTFGVFLRKILPFHKDAE